MGQTGSDERRGGEGMSQGSFAPAARAGGTGGVATSAAGTTAAIPEAPLPQPTAARGHLPNEEDAAQQQQQQQENQKEGALGGTGGGSAATAPRGETEGVVGQGVSADHAASSEAPAAAPEVATASANGNAPAAGAPAAAADGGPGGAAPAAVAALGSAAAATSVERGAAAPAAAGEAAAPVAAPPARRAWVPPHLRRKEAAATAAPETGGGVVLAAAAAVTAATAAVDAPAPPVAPASVLAPSRSPDATMTIPLPTDFTKDSSGGTERFGFAVKQGKRSGMEDTVDAQSAFGETAGSEFYAVYDGHGGVECADYVRTRLPEALLSQQSLRDGGSEIEASLQQAFLKTDAGALQRLLPDRLPTSAPESREVGERDGEAAAMMELSSGTVACVALILGGTVHVANLGDSRAAICYDEGVCKSLTTDHTPKANEGESNRLQAAGIEVSSDGYIHSHLAVSRALGDLDLKTRSKCAGLLATPDITRAEITAEAEFLLVASDGVWEVMTTEEACKRVRRSLRAAGNPKQAAEALAKEALAKESSDNIGVVVVMFKRPPKVY